MNSSPPDVIVIGSGIVGIATALALQSRGQSVCVLDRKGVAAEASQGNAGAFAFAEIEPLAAPGIMRKAPKWLLDPLGPLAIPPAYALRIAPWMLRFWRASWPDRFEAAVSAQAQMMSLSRSALEALIVAVDGEAMMRREGQLQLYESAREFRSHLPAWELRRQHGIPFELLQSPEEIAEIQPGLDARFTHGGYTPTWLNTVDPELWTAHLAQCFTARGGMIRTGEIRALRQQGNSVVLTTANGELRAAQVVVAAGAWSHQLARTVGDRIPLEAERGYNTTLAAGAFDLRTHLTFSGHGFVLSKIGDGIRVGGAVELGGLKLPPNYKRADILLQKAKRFAPGLNTEGGRQWMGFRPSLPDSLPVIGRSLRADRVIYAFGHGHLGLTQSAGTAELVAAIATRQEPAIPMAAFRPDRF